jgi:hypothetical protein
MVRASGSFVTFVTVMCGLLPALSATQGNHVNLSVTDLDRSTEWYCRVFGLVVVGDETTVPAATDQPLRYRSLMDPTTFSSPMFS